MPLFSSSEGPTFAELAKQALSSTQRGYDLLAPKFDYTSFRTPDTVLHATASALLELGPFTSGLDLCTGTGAGVEHVLRRVCAGQPTGVDFSAGMLDRAREVVPGTTRWVQADAMALPFTAAFDLVVSFGAFGHFLPEQRPALFAQVHQVLRPGGLFAFPIGGPPRVGSRAYWVTLAFDAAMRVRNAVWRPRFIMYYRTWRFADVRRDLADAGFEVGTLPLHDLGRRSDGSPRCRLLLARRAPTRTA